jgi:hypothetical protein
VTFIKKGESGKELVKETVTLDKIRAPEPVPTVAPLARKSRFGPSLSAAPPVPPIVTANGVTLVNRFNFDLRNK